MDLLHFMPREAQAPLLMSSALLYRVSNQSAAAAAFPQQTLKKLKGDEEDTRIRTPLNIIGC